MYQASQKKGLLYSEEASQFLSKSEYKTMLICSVVMLAVIVVNGMRHPLRIYLNMDTGQYTGVFYSIIPFYKKKVVFSQNNVRKLRAFKFGFIPWRHNRYTINQTKSIYLFESSFVKPIHFNVMVGYCTYPKY